MGCKGEEEENQLNLGNLICRCGGRAAVDKNQKKKNQQLDQASEVKCVGIPWQHKMVLKDLDTQYIGVQSPFHSWRSNSGTCNTFCT